MRVGNTIKVRVDTTRHVLEGTLSLVGERQVVLMSKYGQRLNDPVAVQNPDLLTEEEQAKVLEGAEEVLEGGDRPEDNCGHPKTSCVMDFAGNERQAGFWADRCDTCGLTKFGGSMYWYVPATVFPKEVEEEELIAYAQKFGWSVEGSK